MKIRKKAVFLVSITAVSLVACGIRSDRSVSSGEMVVPEVSSEDLLVSSLEYLLLDDAEDGTESDGQQDAEDESINQSVQNPAGESEGTPEEQTAQEADAIQGEQAVIYYGDGGSLALQDETVEVESLTPESLIDALAGHNIVSLDTKVLSFEQKDEDGSTVLCLDLSKAFGEYLRTMSKEAECIIVSAVVDTFLENYTGDAVYITVEGEVIVTSRHEYAKPLVRCTPEELLEALHSTDSEDNKTDVMNESGDEVEGKLPLSVEKE